MPADIRGMKGDDVFQKVRLALDRLIRFDEYRRAEPARQIAMAAHLGYRGTDAAELTRLAREYWTDLADALDLCRANLEPVTMPIDIVFGLADIARNLSVGIVPDIIADAAKGAGRRGLARQEADDIAIAVAYIHAARRGFPHEGHVIRISDRRPVRTVSETFGVAERVPGRWLKDTAHARARLAVRADAEWLADAMRRAGERYRMAGRSQAAVHRRGKPSAGAAAPPVATPERSLESAAAPVPTIREAVEQAFAALPDPDAK